MPTKTMLKLLADADGKKKQIITGTKMSMNTVGLRERRFGVVIDGVIYPVIKPMDSTWSLLKSATTHANKKYFKAVVEAVTAVKGKKERFRAYQKALIQEFNVASIASEFAYEYANRKAIGQNLKEGGDRNLYKNQKIDQYFADGVAPLPPAPQQQVEVDSKGRVKNPLESDEGFVTAGDDELDAEDELMRNILEELEDDPDYVSDKDGFDDLEIEFNDAPDPKAKVGGGSAKKKKPKLRKRTKADVDDGEGKTEPLLIAPPTPPSQLPFSQRPRSYDPSKYERGELKNKFEVIKGKAIRVTKLQRGEFGYVFRNLIFPMWKKDVVGSASNSWSMVETRMLKQEQELFRRMNGLNNADAISLYFRFYEDLYLIPTEVLARGLELANNQFTKDLIDSINILAERNGISTAQGYNINFKKESDKVGIFQTIKGFFKLKVDTRKIKQAQDAVADEEFERLQYSQEEIRRLFANIDFYDPNKGSKLTEQELLENIQVERELANPSVRVDADGDIIPPPPPTSDSIDAILDGYGAGDPLASVGGGGGGAIPQPPVNVLQNNNIPNIQMNTEEGANIGDRQKALDEAKRDEATQPMADNIPDLSQHGFQLAIQNVFIKYNKDFSFIKKLVEQNPALKPSEGSIKEQIDLCYAYYSSLFPLPPNDGKYNYGKALELTTLKFQYKRNVEFENAWKSNLGNIGAMGQGGGANMGIIVNTQGLGMSASQLFNQQPPAPPAPQAPQAPLGNAQQQAPQQAPATAQIPQQQGVAQEPLKTKTPDIQKEYKPQPEQAKPKGKRAGKKTMKQRNVVLKIREKKLNPNLLFTKLNSKNPLPEPVGELPSFRIRTKKKNRIRL